MEGRTQASGNNYLAMANPQKENGYTPIANEILDVVARTRFPSGERSVLDVILRKTYGYNKKEDQIAYTQFMEMTGLSRRSVIYIVQNLQAKAVILVSRKRNAVQNDPNTYRFNKNYESWVVQNSAPSVIANRKQAKKGSAKLRKQVVQNSRGSAKPMSKVVQNSVEKLNSFAPTKDKRQYKRHSIGKKADGEIKKELKSKSEPDLIVKLIDSFEGINPQFKRWYGGAGGQRTACDNLIQDHGLEQVLKVMKLLPATNAKAYFPTITTPVQLDNKWAELRSKLLQEKDRTLTNGRGIA